MLPGERGTRFRLKGAEVLSRYLKGDVTLIAEVANNANTISPASELFTPPTDHTSRLFRLSALTAPRLQGKTIADFPGLCVYVLEIKHDEKSMIKLGRSDKFIDRLAAHEKYYKVESVYSVVPCNHPPTVETAVKNRLLPFREPIVINGKRSLEVYYGVTAEEVDRVVTACVEEAELLDERRYNLKRDEIGLRKREIDLEIARLGHQMKVLGTGVAM